MKAIVIVIMVLCCLQAACADNTGQVSIFCAVNASEMPEVSQQLLEQRMQQIVAANGYGSYDSPQRFVLVAKSSVIEKDITTSSPVRISQTIDITFILGDIIENKTYGSISLSQKGVGINETKAWQMAISGIKPANPQFQSLFNESMKKIDAYYASNFSNILDKARALASSGEYDKALSMLLDVPDICHDCYEIAMNKAIEIYCQKIDFEAKETLQRAKNAWAISPDSKGAEKAMAYLDRINVESSIFPSALEFCREISDKISADNSSFASSLSGI